MANRLSQLPVEVAVLPIPNVRLSQLPVEAAFAPISGALLSQIPVEAATVIGAVSFANVLSQLPVEVISEVVGTGTNPGTPRATQTVAEVPLYPTDEIARTTQTVMEVLLHAVVVNVVVENCCITALQDAFPAVAISEVACIDALDVGVPVALPDLTSIDALDTSVQISFEDDCNRLFFNSGVRTTQAVAEPVIASTSVVARVTGVVLEAITKKSFTGMFDPAIFDPAIYDH